MMPTTRSRKSQNRKQLPVRKTTPKVSSQSTTSSIKILALTDMILKVSNQISSNLFKQSISQMMELSKENPNPSQLLISKPNGLER